MDCVNNNQNNGKSDNKLFAADSRSVENLRDICNFLQTPLKNLCLQANICPYEHIVDMIRGLDLQDDGIIMNQKIKSIEMDFCKIVQDETMLFDSMHYINEKALVDSEIAVKFALLFSSRNFDALAMKETKLRSAMLKILETNFINASKFRENDKERLYNSVTLLGEYYNRVRLADNSPITILGESLLELLLRELRDRTSTDILDVKLVKCVLSQITLNGDLLRARHKTELTNLLFHIRRHIIEQVTLDAAVRAILLMTLDVFYNNFKNMGKELEELYMKYYTQPDNIVNKQKDLNLDQQTASLIQNQQQQQQVQEQQQPKVQQQPTEMELKNIDQENGSNELNLDYSINKSTTTTPTAVKKWSEQVCEDSMLENEYALEMKYDAENVLFDIDSSKQHLSSNNANNYNINYQNSTSEVDDQEQRNARRSHRPSNSPRPLRHIQNNHDTNQRYTQYGNRSELQQFDKAETADDHGKPIPRWRATRFNRNSKTESKNFAHGSYANRSHNSNYSSNYDEDCHSVRSEGAGNLRLYSINDRLKHSQEKFERSNPNSNNYSYMVNSNWDRTSQRDDRSERSYISNYEYGNGGGNMKQRHNRRGEGHGYRQNYDRPPRFQKYQNSHGQQQQQQQIGNRPDAFKNRNNDWRRHRTISENSKQDYNSGSERQSDGKIESNDHEVNDGSYSRARTLPRPAKSHNNSKGVSIKSASFRRSNDNILAKDFEGNQSSTTPLVNENGTRTQQQQRKNSRNYRNSGGWARGSNASDKEGFIKSQQPNNVQDETDISTELAWNARQTAQYIDYLTSQK